MQSPPNDQGRGTSAEPSGSWRPALLVALAYLALALPLLPSQGATWDCVMGEYPYGERLLEYVLSGDEAFLTLNSLEPRPTVREPHPDFEVGRFEWYQVHPLGSLLSAVSCRVLWTELGLVPALQAHNLVVPLLVAGLLAAMVRFAAPRVGRLAAVCGALLLVASPRFFAHAFNNLKDAPETCLYVVASLAGFVALERGALRWWIGCGILTGLALAQKGNAVFLPVQLALFVLLARRVPGLRCRAALRGSLEHLLLAAVGLVVALYLVSPRYWSEPFMGPWSRFGELMRMGNQGLDAGSGGMGRVTLYAPLFIATTTPPLVLILALVGLLSKRMSPPLRAFLVAALVTTVGRNMLPGTRNFGGIRHFLEFAPYLCMAAGVGLVTVADALSSRLSGRVSPLTSRRVHALFVGACLITPAWQTARTHPNGIGYFNATVGGLAGAQARRIPGATDYWGNSYWQAFEWINENAEPGAWVLVPIGGHVATSIAPVRLRPDLELWRKDRQAERSITYVAYITSEDRYPPLVLELEKRCEPVHEIGLQGGTLLRVFRLDTDPLGDELIGLWERKRSSGETAMRIRKWMDVHPEEAREVWAHVRRLNEVGLEKTLKRLRRCLPEELHDGLEDVAWNRLEP